MIRPDGTYSCPACKVGTMCQHDEGYDECDSCNFWALYWPGELEGDALVAEYERQKVWRDKAAEGQP